MRFCKTNPNFAKSSQNLNDLIGKTARLIIQADKWPIENHDAGFSVAKSEFYVLN